MSKVTINERYCFGAGRSWFFTGTASFVFSFIIYNFHIYAALMIYTLGMISIISSFCWYREWYRFAKERSLKEASND